MEGYPLRWSLKSEQIWGTGQATMSACACRSASAHVATKAHRELVLEYPFEEGAKIAPSRDRTATGWARISAAPWRRAGIPNRAAGLFISRCGAGSPCLTSRNELPGTVRLC